VRFFFRGFLDFFVFPAVIVSGFWIGGDSGRWLLALVLGNTSLFSAFEEI